MIKQVAPIEFPDFSGIRCLMMPYIQGEIESVPEDYRNGYEDIIASTFFKKGEVGFLTIDESIAKKGSPHRGDRSKYNRALHTEAGRSPNKTYIWHPGGEWGESDTVTLDANVKVMLANNLDCSCAIWDAVHENTSSDGDIGDFSNEYPYSDAIMMKAGEVYEIGIFTPHESVPVEEDVDRQFIRIISSGVHGREDYFTENPLMLM